MTRGKRAGLKARSKNARSGKKVTNVLAVMHLNPSMRFVERFAAAAPEYRPLVVVTLSGLMLFGMRQGPRFCVHVPLEDMYKDYCDMLQLSHWMEVVAPVFAESAEAPPPKPPDRSEDVYV